MVNKKTVLILIILSIFTIGLLCGSCTASKTFHKGKYKVTISDSKWKKIKKGQLFSKKVGTKKKTVWVTKKMKTYESWVDSNGYMYKSKSWNPYQKFGYNAKYVKSVWKYYSDGDICWEYYKVKTTVKEPVFFHINSKGYCWLNDHAGRGL